MPTVAPLLVAAACGSASPPRWNAALGVWEGDRAAGGVEVPDPLYIFGYGSLCWKAEFPFSTSFVGRVRGWTRYFAQKSTDHRGTPESPGLVCTLLSDAELAGLGVTAVADSSCAGVCYRVASADAEAVLSNLDFREKGGYTRSVVDVAPADGAPTVRALLYTANAENPGFDARAVADPAAAARTIRDAVGPSGPNRVYLERLAAWLTSMGESDGHVDELMAHLSAGET
jgi:cation transport regulator ChaC